jgi:hypothetical protein
MVRCISRMANKIFPNVHTTFYVLTWACCEGFVARRLFRAQVIKTGAKIIGGADGIKYIFEPFFIRH